MSNALSKRCMLIDTLVQLYSELLPRFILIDKLAENPTNHTKIRTFSKFLFGSLEYSRLTPIIHSSFKAIIASLFQVFDYTQYYLDLSRANANVNRNAEWMVEYNFSTYYSINEINAANLHSLADKLTHHYPQENSIFDR